MLLELTQELGSSLRIDETLALLASRLKPVIPYDGIAIYTLQGSHLITRYAAGDDAAIAARKSVGPLNDGRTMAAIQPAFLTHGDKRQILCRSKHGRIVESWSKDGGKTWSELTLTDLPNPNSGIDAVIDPVRRTSAAPPARLGKISSTLASKPIDANCRTRSSGPSPYTSRAHRVKRARAPCSTMTPLGLPVEPDV